MKSKICLLVAFFCFIKTFAQDQANSFITYTNQPGDEYNINGDDPYTIEYATIPNCFISWGNEDEIYRQFAVDIGNDLFICIPVHNFNKAIKLNERQKIFFTNQEKKQLRTFEIEGNLLGEIKHFKNLNGINLADLDSIKINKIPETHKKIKHKISKKIWELKTENGSSHLISDLEFQIYYKQGISYSPNSKGSYYCTSKEKFSIELSDGTEVPTSLDRFKKIEIDRTKNNTAISVVSKKNEKKSSGTLKLSVGQPQNSGFGISMYRSIRQWTISGNSIDFPGTAIIINSKKFSLTLKN